ncbi:hypothetical protein IQ219_19375, partial [Synechocystis sp. LEGE 06083]|uniref:RHS repeat-associated core domain-containing protein n=1 Tax=Synechocystis sp. LEGE 06083 TaxID=915336 RepID=UPI001A07BB35
FTGRKLPLTEADVVVGFAPHVTSLSDYYPFGSGMEGRTVPSTYRYGYGGHELEQDNLLDMGDRWLDSRIGRTMKLDKYVDDYQWISGYTYAANNPLLCIDIHGERIYIHYQTESGEDAKYEYGSGLEVPNDPFVRGTVAALNRISESPNVSDRLDVIISSDLNVTITPYFETQYHAAIASWKDMDGVKQFEVKPDQEVKFNMNLGLQEASTGVVNPPFISLWHELGHLYNAITDTEGFVNRHDQIYDSKDVSCEDHVWTNEEERVNIQQNEWPLAVESEGFERQTHKVGGRSGVVAVKTNGPLSTEVVKQ